MADLPNPHDKLFRALLGDPERARAFLRDHLPNSIVAQLADTLPEIIEGSFVDEALAGSQSDLLLKVELANGEPGLVFVLAEHKSSPDPGLPLQMATYMVRVWKSYAGTSSVRLRKLPPIIPVVVYHGSANWTVPDSLRDMIATEDDDLAFLPGAGYILRNLRAMEIDELSRNAALRMGFLTLRRDILGFLADLIRYLPEGSDLRRQLLEYVLRVYKVDMDELMSILRNEGHTELEAEMQTIAETLLEQGKAAGIKEGKAAGIAEGEARGKAAGIAEGLAVGMAEGEAKSLIRLLERRFGPLPHDIEARIGAAELEEIEAWLDAVLDAPDLAALFGKDARH